MQEPAPGPKLVEEWARELVPAQEQRLVLAAPAEQAATIAAEEEPLQPQAEANQELKDQQRLAPLPQQVVAPALALGRFDRHQEQRRDRRQPWSS